MALASQGPLNAATCSDVNVSGLPWVNPTNAQGAPNGYLQYAEWGNNTVLNSDFLQATGFGFTLPTGAGIKVAGVSATIYIRKGSGSLTPVTVKLVKAGVIQATNRGNNFDLGASTSSTFGSSSDLWGATLTPSDINASNFGVAISVAPGGVFGDGQVNAFAITVTYRDLTFAPTTLPPAQSLVAYSQNITVTNANSPTFSVLSGSLPAGLSLSSAGLVSGTPTYAAGAGGPISYPITVQVSDGADTNTQSY